MIKLKSLISESKTLIPRRSGPEREKRWMQEIYKKIQDYIKNGCEELLDLSGTPIKILPDNLKKVDSLWLQNSKIEDLNNLEYVGRNLELFSTPLKKLPNNLKKVGGNLNLYNSQIEDLNNLEYVNNSLIIDNTSKLKSLGNLKVVGGDTYCFDSNILNVMSSEEIRCKVKIHGNLSWRLSI